MATTFIGFSAQQQHTLQADLTLAKKLAMSAVNSMLLTFTGRPADQTAQLLWWVFTVRADKDVWDRVDPIKSAYLAFGLRLDTVSLNYDSSPPAPNTIEFDAYVRPGHASQIFCRSPYFAKTPRDRALTLIHEFVHLRFSDNSGDGHSGGQIIMSSQGISRSTTRMRSVTPTATSITPTGSRPDSTRSWAFVDASAIRRRAARRGWFSIPRRRWIPSRRRQREAVKRSSRWQPLMRLSAGARPDVRVQPHQIPRRPPCRPRRRFLARGSGR